MNKTDILLFLSSVPASEVSQLARAGQFEAHEVRTCIEYLITDGLVDRHSAGFVRVNDAGRAMVDKVVHAEISELARILPEDGSPENYGEIFARMDYLNVTLMMNELHRGRLRLCPECASVGITHFVHLIDGSGNIDDCHLGGF